MAVLPESMNKLNLTDTTGSLGELERYINYMGERIEFAMSNMTRSVSDAGVSNVDVLQAIAEVTGALSRLNSAASRMAGETTSTSTRIDKMQESIDAIRGNITTMQADIAALGERIAALEGNGG